MKTLLLLIIASTLGICISTTEPIHAQGIQLSQTELTMDASLSESSQVANWVIPTLNQGIIKNLSVVVVSVQTPSGMGYGKFPVSATWTAKGQVSIDLPSEGAGLLLMFDDVRAFKEQGKYVAKLRFIGTKHTPQSNGRFKSDPFSEMETIHINRPEAKVNSASLSNMVLSLKRKRPGSTVNEEAFSVILSEITGRADLTDMHVNVEKILEEDKGVLKDGDIKVSVKPINGANDNYLKALGEAELKMGIKGIKKTGKFTADIYVNSPSLKERAHIPVKIEVGDQVWFPLLAIAVGVIVGFIFTWLKDHVLVGRGIEEELIDLEERHKYWVERVSDEARYKKLSEIKVNLTAASTILENKKYADAEKKLAEVRGKLAVFVHETYMAVRVATNKRDVLEKEISNFLSQNDPGSDVKQVLNNLLDRILEVNELLWGEYVDRTNGQLDMVRKEFEAVKKKIIFERIEVLDLKIKNVRGSRKRNNLQADLTNIRKTLNSGDLIAARENIEELERKVNDLISPDLKSFSSNTSSLEGNSTDFVKGPWIEVIPPNGPLLGGSLLTFNLKLAPFYSSESIDYIKWNLGYGEDREAKGAIYEKGDHSVEFSYRFPGTYTVSARVTTKDKETLTVNKEIKIEPNKSQIKQRKLKRLILINQIVISTISLFIAILGGFVYLYFDDIFGSMQDYILAILFGFGVDSMNKAMAFFNFIGR